MFPKLRRTPPSSYCFSSSSGYSASIPPNSIQSPLLSLTEAHHDEGGEVAMRCGRHQGEAHHDEGREVTAVPGNVLEPLGLDDLHQAVDLHAIGAQGGPLRPAMHLQLEAHGARWRAHQFSALAWREESSVRGDR